MSGDWAGNGGSFIKMSVGAMGAVGHGDYTVAGMISIVGSGTALGQWVPATLGDSVDIIESSDAWFGWNDFSSGFGGPLVHGDWYIVALTHADASAGNTPYVWGSYDQTAATAPVTGQSTGSAGQPNMALPVDHLEVGLGQVNGASKIAWLATWGRILSASEFASMCTAKLSDVAALSPSALITLDGWDGATGCVDVVGSSAQLALSGTVAVGANPPGYDFTLTPAAASSPRPCNGTPGDISGSLRWRRAGAIM
jgi:hypothetical protein